MVTHPTMNGSTRDEVHPPPKNFGQSLRKILDLPPQTHTRFQRKQEINVAIKASIPTRHGTENFKARDPVAFTQFAQTFLVHDLDRHAQSLDATQPIPRQRFTEPHPELRRRHPTAPRFAGPIVERQPYRRKRQPSCRTPALQRKQTTTRQANPGRRRRIAPQRKRQPSCRTPALQRKQTTTRQANPGQRRRTAPQRKRQPYGPTPALPSNASLPVERQRYSASKRPQDKRALGRRRRTAVSTW